MVRREPSSTLRRSELSQTPGLTPLAFSSNAISPAEPFRARAVLEPTRRIGATHEDQIGNLSKQITDAQLSELAAPFGKPQSANVATERSSGASKGFGFVEFGSADEAKAAIVGLDGKDVNGQVLKVSEAKSKT